MIIIHALLMMLAHTGPVDEMYAYDARGRLVSSTSSSASREVHTVIVYDPAGNRRSYTVNGVGEGGSGVTGANRRLIVVPLNGFTVIPIKE